MQGLWKNKISGYNSKDIKRKKQSFRHYCKDKLVGNYRRNNMDITVNDKRNILNRQYNETVKTETNIIATVPIQLINFKRTVKLSKRFIKKNCDGCQYNVYYREAYDEKQLKRIEERDTTEEHKNSLRAMLRFRKWCNLDLYSVCASTANDYNAKTWFFNKDDISCMKKLENIELSYEYKHFKVIKYEGIYYEDYKGNLYPISKEWELVSIVNPMIEDLDILSAEHYTTGGEVRHGKYLYKNKSLEYKYLKELDYCYNSNGYRYDSKTYRSKSKAMCKSLIYDTEKYYEYEIPNRKQMFVDYY